MGSRRNRRLDATVRQALAEIVEQEIADPRLTFFTITDVEVSLDSSYATVYWTSIDPDVVSGDVRGGVGDPVAAPHEVEAGLEAAAPRIRSLLGRRLSTRRTPELRFHRDPVVERAGRVEELLRRLRAEGGA